MHKLVIILFLPIASLAQDYSPFGNSNYAGVYSTVINPALSSYTPYNWHVNLLGAELNVNNNYARLDMPYSPYKLIRNKIPPVYLTADGNPQFNKYWVRIKNSNNNKHLGALAYVMGPSASVSIKNFNIGLRTEAFANARAYCIDKIIANAIFYEFDSSQGAFDYARSQINLGKNEIKEGTLFGGGFAALAFPVSYKITKLKWEQDLAIGIAPKLVWGMGYVAAKYSDINLISTNNDSMIFSPFSAQSAYSTQIKRSKAVDIGVVYTFKKPGPRQSGNYHNNKTKYHTRLGFSITNIGRINYTQSNLISVRSTGNIKVYKNTFYPNNNSNIDSTLQSAWRNFGTVSSSTGATKVGLPTALNLTADHQIKPFAFVNVQWTQSLRALTSFNMRTPSSLKITPRYQKQYWEVGVPISMIYDYRSLRMGIYGRLGPIFIGTHSLNGLINTRNTSDYDIFFGLNISHLKRAKTKKEQDKEDAKIRKKKADKCGEM